MTNTNEAVKRVERFLDVWDEDPTPIRTAINGELSNADFRPLNAADLRTLLAALKRLRNECEAFRSEADKAKAQVRAWNDVVYVEGIPMRYLPDTDFGDKVEPIPYVTPQRVTDLLDEVSRLRSTEAKCPVCRAADREALKGDAS